MVARAPRALASAYVQYQLPFSNPNIADGWGATAGRAQAHRGLDFPQNSGTLIPAVANGSVAWNGTSSALGWIVVLSHADGMFSGYSHMVEKSPLPVGTLVSRGSVIGKVGHTGTSAIGNHLHLTVTYAVDGTWNNADRMATTVDPYKYIMARTKGHHHPGEEDGEMAQYYRNGITGQIGRFAGGVTIFADAAAYEKHRVIVGIWNSQNPPAFQQPTPPSSSSAANFISLDDYGWNVQIAAHGGVF